MPAANAGRPPGRASTAMDPLREPTLHAGRRFRFDELSFTSAAGKAYPAMLFRPCDASCTEMPAGLDRFAPPYPGVVIMHGGAANQEMYWWAAEGLAEAGLHGADGQHRAHRRTATTRRSRTGWTG